MAQSDNGIEMPALGRPFQLGMLYDCRKDALIPGITLWDLESLQRNLNIRPQPKTESEILMSDSIDDKASALNISAALKASFLGGLIEVGGSAKYLQDTKTSRQQARVTLHYKATTKYEQLTMSHLGIQNVSYPAVFEHGTATHVVTAILYGAQAFFVFDREVFSSETVQKIERNIKVLIGKIISFTGEAEMSEKEKSRVQSIQCKFHGDFSLKSNPVSFQDAKKIYASLPIMLGEDGEKAVPVRVWLYPLSKLDSKAAKMVHEVSLALIADVKAVMEQVNEIKMRCNDLAKNPIPNTFPEIKKKIQQFKNLCNQYRQIFQKELARALPSIRGGEKEEGALVDILMSINQSPFNSQRLHEFLDTKEREIHFVKSYLAILNGMEVITSQKKLEEKVLDEQNEFVVSFTFTSLHDEEPFLSSLHQWIKKPFLHKMSDPKTGRFVPEKYKAWFEHEENSQNAWKAAKSISDFSRVNKSDGKTRCIVASVPDGDNPGASIYLCENGELVSSSFELPSKPLPLLIGGIGHDYVQLTLQPAEYGRASVLSYQVEYKITGEEGWKAVDTEDSQETFLLGGLSPNTEYQFRYAARSKPGLSESSDVTQPVKTLPTSPPREPREVTVGPSVISVAWESPSVLGVGVLIKEYKVEYRGGGREGNESGKDEWNEKRTGGETEFCEIDSLKSQSPYRVRVSAVCADGAQSDPSEEVEVSTSRVEEGKTRLAYKYLPESTLIEMGVPSVYALPLQKATRDASTSRLKYQLGKENLQVPNKVIMMIGATGSGKTTLINGMVNYILGVEWEDAFRFKLIHKVTNGSQAESETAEVTTYVLSYREGFKIPYSLTIIDTPGFGNTTGTECSKFLREQIQEFFSNPGSIDHIDALCLVVQASFGRLPPDQKYVFDSVLSIFGKDIKDNTQVLITFADGQAPPVLEAIQKADVPCAKEAHGSPVHFKFNNSALFANSRKESGGSFNGDEMFWQMGTESMKAFFDSLNKLATGSLSLTKEVLRVRKELDAVVERLQPHIKTGLVKREELRKTQHALNQCKDDVAANQHFEYEVVKTVPVKEEISGSGSYAVNCTICQFTCHYPCGSPGDADRPGCAALNPNSGSCAVCPGQCAWEAHLKEKFRFQYKVVKEKKTYEELKQKYEKACGERKATEKTLRNLCQEYEEVRGVLGGLAQKASQSLQRLQEMALKPSFWSAPQYVDLLIMSEQQQLKPGYQGRIQTLKGVKEAAEITQKIANQEPLLPGEQGLYAQGEPRKPPPPRTATLVKGGGGRS
ncbi:uncharacterized protein LOC134413381 [Elgaria multicarinata webbii]|uniref:uncharacterized protein LOC134413381 n=1 Tax=Elgaria multicarinata webbii TaxID=159646 RepID=UPI002FCD3C25